jgi:hypothetical protein
LPSNAARRGFAGGRFGGPLANLHLFVRLRRRAEHSPRDFYRYLVQIGLGDLRHEKVVRVAVDRKNCCLPSNWYTIGTNMKGAEDRCAIANKPRRVKHFVDINHSRGIRTVAMI